MTRTALLLVDLQRDFAREHGLVPPLEAVSARAAALLAACRAASVPVFHAHTRVRPDGRDRMPHLVDQGRWLCVEGTPGAEPLDGLGPGSGERVFTKTVFSAFSNPALAEALAAERIERLMIAGLHTHACVAKTALDAYERGLEVWLVADASGSYDPLHARVTREYLSSRGVRVLDTGEVPFTSPAPLISPVLPEAMIGGRWIAGRSPVVIERRNPSLWSEVLANVPCADARTLREACAAARRGYGSVARMSHDKRAEAVLAVAAALERRKGPLVAVMANEVGKPVRDAAEEVARAIALCKAACATFPSWPASVRCAGAIVARRRPVGVIAAVTPWNNPVALAVGKVVPALLFGNAVVWKPAPEAPRTSMMVAEAVAEAGFPAEAFSMVLGDGLTAQALIADADVDRVTITGGPRTGRDAAQAAGALLKAIQAELGGNNAAIVMPDFDLGEAARELALSAFGFSGQRCTGTRRVIVPRQIHDDLIGALFAAVRALPIGQPSDERTVIGPLISRQQQERVRALARRAGAIAGAEVDPQLEKRGCWQPPWIVLGADPASPVVQEETFGPLLVIQRADDEAHAYALANGVSQGLVASVFTHDDEVKQRFLETVEAGVLKIGQGTRGVHLDAPFGGWKASGLGPPEHGTWDAEHFTRLQAVYEGS